MTMTDVGLSLSLSFISFFRRPCFTTIRIGKIKATHTILLSMVKHNRSLGVCVCGALVRPLCNLRHITPATAFHPNHIISFFFLPKIQSTFLLKKTNSNNNNKNNINNKYSPVAYPPVSNGMDQIDAIEPLFFNFFQFVFISLIS